MLKITQTKKTENNEMKNRIEDKSQRKSAVIVGVLILIGYGVLFSGGLEPLIVMLIELISGVAVIGIAVIMFPILKPYNKGLTLGYVVSKVVEGAILIIGGILLLSLSTTLLEVRDWIYVSHAYIFIIGALADSLASLADQN